MGIRKMSLNRTLSNVACALCTVIVLGAISSACSGQGLQRPLRWLGEGYGPGYHRCNPGPNSDYYNPYSAHNSTLISQLPQFQNQNYQSYSTSNLASRPVYQGVPFSVYAAPRGVPTQSYGYHQMGGTVSSPTINGSFEPYEPTQEDEEDTEEEDFDEADRDEDYDDYEDYEDMEEDDMDASESDETTSKKASEESVFKYTPKPENQTSGMTTKRNAQSGFARTSVPSQKEANPQADENLFNPFDDE